MSKQQPKISREIILAQWDSQSPLNRQMCAHWLLKLHNATEVSLREAQEQGWHAAEADLKEGLIALEIAMDLLAHKGDACDEAK